VGWIDGAAAALEASVLGTWARGSAIGYPLANLAHLLGLVLLIGPIGLLDLRMAGLFRDIPLRPLARATVPLAAIGLLLLAPSGLVMFAADATALVGAPIFQWKMAVIVLLRPRARPLRRLGPRRVRGLAPDGRRLSGALADRRRPRPDDRLSVRNRWTVPQLPPACCTMSPSAPPTLLGPAPSMIR
jgi:hypothetical protein